MPSWLRLSTAAFAPSRPACLCPLAGTAWSPASRPGCPIPHSGTGFCTRVAPVRTGSCPTAATAGAGAGRGRGHRGRLPAPGIGRPCRGPGGPLVSGPAHTALQPLKEGQRHVEKPSVAPARRLSRAGRCARAFSVAPRATGRAAIAAPCGGKHAWAITEGRRRNCCRARGLTGKPSSSKTFFFFYFFR